MKSYIETRAVEIANYIVENNATVRQAAKVALPDHIKIIKYIKCIKRMRMR